MSNVPTGAWTPEDEPAQERYRDLILQRGQELGHTHGWKKLVADELGVRPEHLSRILRRERRASIEKMHAAAERYGFSLDYFFDRSDRAYSKQDGTHLPANSVEPGQQLVLEERSIRETLSELEEQIVAGLVPDLQLVQGVAQWIVRRPQLVHAYTFVDAHGNPRSLDSSENDVIAALQRSAPVLALTARKLLSDRNA